MKFRFVFIDTSFQKRGYACIQSAIPSVEKDVDVAFFVCTHHCTFCLQRYGFCGKRKIDSSLDCFVPRNDAKRVRGRSPASAKIIKVINIPLLKIFKINSSKSKKFTTFAAPKGVVCPDFG